MTVVVFVSPVHEWYAIHWDTERWNHSTGKKFIIYLCLPCCSIRSLFGSVHEMNATANQSPAFGPSMLNLRIIPSDLNCKLYISNLQERRGSKKNNCFFYSFSTYRSIDTFDPISKIYTYLLLLNEIITWKSKRSRNRIYINFVYTNALNIQFSRLINKKRQRYIESKRWASQK